MQLAHFRHERKNTPRICAQLHRSGLGVVFGCWSQKAWKAAVLAISAGGVAALALLPYLKAKLVELHCSGRAFGISNLYETWGFPFVWLSLLLFVIVIGLCFRPVEVEPGKRQMALFLGVTLLTAIIGFLLFCWFGKMSTQRWYFLPLMGLMAACFDGCWPLTPKSFRHFGLGFIAAFVLVVIPYDHHQLRWRFTNVDLIAKQITSKAVPGDYVIVSPWFDGISFNRYFKDNIAWTTLPPLANHTTHDIEALNKQMQNPEALAPVFKKISLTLQAGGSVWFIVSGELYITACNPSGNTSPIFLKVSLDGNPSDMSSYMKELDAQVKDFLWHNAKEIGKESVPFSHGVISGDENPNLYLAKGWREQTQAHSPAN